MANPQVVQIHCGSSRRRSKQRPTCWLWGNSLLCWIKITMAKMCQHKDKRPDCKCQDLAASNQPAAHKHSGESQYYVSVRWRICPQTLEQMTAASEFQSGNKTKTEWLEKQASRKVNQRKGWWARTQDRGSTVEASPELNWGQLHQKLCFLFDFFILRDELSTCGHWRTGCCRWWTDWCQVCSQSWPN